MKAMLKFPLKVLYTIYICLIILSLVPAFLMTMLALWASNGFTLKDRTSWDMGQRLSEIDNEYFLLEDL